MSKELRAVAIGFFLGKAVKVLWERAAEASGGVGPLGFTKEQRDNACLSMGGAALFVWIGGIGK